MAMRRDVMRMMVIVLVIIVMMGSGDNLARKGVGRVIDAQEMVHAVENDNPGLHRDSQAERYAQHSGAAFQACKAMQQGVSPVKRA